MKKEEDQKMKSLIAILVIVIICLGGYIVYTKYKESQNRKLQAAYNRGVNDAQIATYNQIISELGNYGSVGFTFIDANNRSQTIRLAPVQQQASTAAASR